MTKTVTRAAIGETKSLAKAGAGRLVPAQPESARITAKRRKRLAKLFSRPLEKEHKEQQLVREKFSVPPLEYDQLLEIKQRLAAQGSAVKKSELVRAGLMLLAAQDDESLRALLARVRGAA